MGRAETVVMPVCLGLALTDETAFQDPRDSLDLVIASGSSIFKTFLPARPTGSLNLCRLQRDLPCLHHLSPVWGSVPMVSRLAATFGSCSSGRQAS